MFGRMKRFWSALLVFALMCQMVPLSVFAEEHTERIEAEEIEIEPEETGIESKEVILEEITDKRTEHSKEFRTSQGNYMAVLYAEAVHYEEEGEWKEIDNTLTMEEDGVYRNTAGVWEVSLPQLLDAEKEISITKDGYTLSFGLAGELLKEDLVVDIPIVKPEEETMDLEVEEPAAESAEESAADVMEEIQDEQIESEITEESIYIEETRPEEIEESLTETPLEESSVEVTLEENEEAVEKAETEGETKAEDETEIETETEIIQSETEQLKIKEAVKLNEDGYRIKEMQPTAGEIQETGAEEAKEAAEHEELINEKLVSQLLYEEVYENTDVKYDLQSNRVKESVILESYNEKLQGYRYEVNTGAMIPVLREDGRIDFYDENERELIMMMEAPFLMDEKGDYNSDVQVSLEGEEGSYILEYKLPTKWLAAEERAWPVVLDPVITASADVKNIQDATVASKTVFEYTRPINEVGYYSVDGKERFFIKYATLPSLESSDVILGAHIYMYKPNTSPASAVVQVHKVNEVWDSQTITWSNKPSYNSKVEDYMHVEE